MHTYLVAINLTAILALSQYIALATHIHSQKPKQACSIVWAVGFWITEVSQSPRPETRGFQLRRSDMRTVIFCQPAYDGTLDLRYLQFCGSVLFGHGDPLSCMQMS